MKIQYDPALMEEVISLAVKRGEERGDLRLFQEYHTLADALYERFSSERREEAFLKLHRTLFQKWGFSEPIARALEEFPEVGGLVREIFVARALAKKEEGADLSQDRRSVGIKVRSERFLEAKGLRRFLRHELQHIADMLDPTFDSIPQEILASSPMEENLIKDRYRALWAISVDGRLSKGGKETIASKEERWREFEALYWKIPSPQRLAIFDHLWEGKFLTHREILAMAKDPAVLLQRAGAATDNECPPKKVLLPGSPCPLCCFPTYLWVEEFDEVVIEQIKRDFPGWGPEEAACGRCVEVYSLSAQPLAF
ncbi:MAG: hypothetical protein HY347_12020 [candidate division NC10 bacterium]|nr:hypothetical protein [candidate division NC10 bacterium]